nr:hypothetical protein [Tanacetum cinerariifolium]
TSGKFSASSGKLPIGSGKISSTSGKFSVNRGKYLLTVGTHGALYEFFTADDLRKCLVSNDGVRKNVLYGLAPFVVGLLGFIEGPCGL